MLLYQRKTFILTVQIKGWYNLNRLEFFFDRTIYFPSECIFGLVKTMQKGTLSILKLITAPFSSNFILGVEHSFLISELTSCFTSIFLCNTKMSLKFNHVSENFIAILISIFWVWSLPIQTLQNTLKNKFQFFTLLGRAAFQILQNLYIGDCCYCKGFCHFLKMKTLYCYYMFL